MKKRKRPKTATTRSRFYRPARPLLVLTCLFLTLTSSSRLEGRKRPAPDDYAIIFGTVWGPDDRPLAAVKVKIRRAEDKKARWEVYSSPRGEFEQRVPVGKHDYVIWADLKGYKAPNGRRLQPGAQVTVHIESNERADTGLHLQ